MKAKYATLCRNLNVDENGIILPHDKQHSTFQIGSTKRLLLILLMDIQFLRSYIFNVKLFMRLIFYILIVYFTKLTYESEFYYTIKQTVIRHDINPTECGFPFVRGSKGTMWGPVKIHYTVFNELTWALHCKVFQ